MIDESQQNLQLWHRILKKARLAAPITKAQLRLAICGVSTAICSILSINDITL